MPRTKPMYARRFGVPNLGMLTRSFSKGVSVLMLTMVVTMKWSQSEDEVKILESSSDEYDIQNLLKFNYLSIVCSTARMSN